MANNQIKIEFSGIFKKSDIDKMATQMKSVMDLSKMTLPSKEAMGKQIAEVKTWGAEIEKILSKDLVSESDIKDLERLIKKVKEASTKINNDLGVVGPNLRKIEKDKLDKFDAYDEVYRKAEQDAKKQLAINTQRDLKKSLTPTGIAKEINKTQGDIERLKIEKEASTNTQFKKEKTQEIREYSEELKKLIALQHEYQTLINKAEGVRKTSKKSSQAKADRDAAAATENFEVQLKNLGASTEPVIKQGEGLGVAIEQGKEAFAKSTAAAQTYGRAMGDIKSKIMQVTSVVFLLRKAFQSIKKSVDIVSELDKEFVQIGIVSKQTTDELWGSFDTFNQMAKNLNTTTKQYLEGAKIFYQQGYQLSEVISLVDATTKAATLSATDFKSASEALTAAIRAFNMTAADAASITDKYAAVGAYSAADFRELSVSMEKVASSAYSAGMSFDFTLGILAKGIETTKEAPEAIGTALKTIVARFQEMKEDPTKILEDGVNANRVEKALKTVGVSLRDSAGQFRDLELVFNELGEKWGDLSRNQRAYIATISAGMRQQSRFMAIMNNYDRTLELVRTSTNSAGEANKQYAIYTDSVEAAQNRLKNTSEAFYASITSSNAIKELYDIASVFLGALTAINPKMLALVGTVGVLTYTVAKYRLVHSLTNKSEVTGIILSKIANSTRLQSIAMTLGLTKAKNAETVATNALTLSTGALSVVMLSTIAIAAALVVVIVLIAKAIEKQKNAVHELAAKERERAIAAREEATNTEAKIERYKELDRKLQKTNEEQNEFLELSKEIAEIHPDLVEGIDRYGNYILKTGEALESTIQKMKEYAIQLEEVAVKARLASMAQAQWNADVAHGAPGEKTSNAAKLIEDNFEQIASGGENSEYNFMTGLFGESWGGRLLGRNAQKRMAAGVSKEDLIKQMSSLIDRRNVGTAAVLPFGGPLLDSFIMTKEEKTFFLEELDKQYDSFERLNEIRLAETRMEVGNQLSSLGRGVIDSLSFEGIEVSNEYANVLSQLAFQATEIATEGIEGTEEKTKAILEQGPIVYNEMLKNLEEYADNKFFQKSLRDITELKNSGASILEINEALEKLFSTFEVDNRDTAKAIADSFYDKEALEETSKKIAKIIYGEGFSSSNSKEVQERISKLSSDTYKYFMDTFMYMEEGDQKNKLVSAFSKILGDDNIAQEINKRFGELDLSSVVDTNDFIKYLSETMGENEGEIKDFFNIWIENIQLASQSTEEYLKKIKELYEKYSSLDSLLKKSSSGLIQLGDVFEYLAENGEEAIYAIKNFGENYFLSFSTLLKNKNKVKEEINDYIKDISGGITRGISEIEEKNSSLSFKITTDSLSFEEWSKNQIKPYSKEIDNLQKQLAQFDSTYTSELSEELTMEREKIIGSINALEQELANKIQYSEYLNFLNAQEKINEELKEQILYNEKQIENQKILKSAYDTLAESLEKISLVQQAIIEKQGLVDSISAINSSIEGLKDFGEVFKKLKEGPISFLETMQLIGKNPDLLLSLEITKEGAKLTENSLLLVAEMKKKEVEQFIDGEIAKLEVNLALLKTREDSETETVENINETEIAAAKDTISAQKIEYENALAIYEVVAATAKIRGQVVPDFQGREFIESTELATSALEELREQYKGMDDSSIEKTLEKRIEELKNLKTTWMNLSPEQMLDMDADSLKEANDQLEKIIDLRKQIYDALIEADERELDQQKKLYDEKTEIENKYLEAVKKAIDKERELRDQNYSEEELAQKRRKLAVLERDSSGSFSQEVIALRKEISDDERNLRDAAVDKQYEALQEQYELQQEQRDIEIQIREELIAQQKLNGHYWRLVDQSIKDGPTAIENILTNTNDYLQMDPLAKSTKLDEWKNQLTILMNAYNAGIQKLGNNADIISAIREGLKGIIIKSPSIQINDEDTTETKNVVNLINNFPLHSKEDIPSSTTSTSYSNPIFTNKSSIQMMPYKEGGLVDYTGPAQVHGSKTNPEAFLNSDQTRIFAGLRDFLERSMNYGFGGQTSNNESIIVGDITVNLANRVNSSGIEIGKLVRKEIMDVLKNRSTISIPKAR